MDRRLTNFMINANLALLVVFFSPGLVLEILNECNWVHNILIWILLAVLLLIVRSLIYCLFVMRMTFKTSRVGKWIFLVMIGLNALDLLTTFFSGSELKLSLDFAKTHESNAMFAAIFNINAPGVLIIIAAILLKTIYVLVVLIQYLLFEYFLRNFHKCGSEMTIIAPRHSIINNIKNAAAAFVQLFVFPRIIASNCYSYRNTRNDGRFAASALQFFGFYIITYIAVVLFVVNNILVIIELANVINVSMGIKIIKYVYTINIIIMFIYIPLSSLVANKIVAKYINGKIVGGCEFKAMSH